MAEELPLLSIVCPAYQEEEVLPLFHAALTETLEPLSWRFRFEIVYVDDGSRDRTLAIIRRIAGEDCRVRYLSLSRNFGHQAALTAGMEHARGAAVVTLDADLQHPPVLIPDLITRWQEGFDIVLTIRADDPRLGWFKRTSSALFYRLLRHWSDTDVRAAASDFRLLSRPALDALRAMPEVHRYLRGMVQWLGFAVAEVPFQPDPRRAGISKYTLRRPARPGRAAVVLARAAAIGHRGGLDGHSGESSGDARARHRPPRRPAAHGSARGRASRRRLRPGRTRRRRRVRRPHLRGV
jgi:glycosyltransferase involved in cell wall biosynthesis